MTEKKNSFDVTIGSYAGAEACEFASCFLLFQLQAKFGQNIGLYRGYDLAITVSFPRARENIEKEICRFTDNRICITIDANKGLVNFLDVAFNLAKNSYQPYTKPNTTLQYVHCERNHPPNNEKKHTSRSQQMPLAPLIRQSLVWPSHTPVPESTKWEQLLIHPPIWPNYDKQEKEQTKDRDPLI